MNVVKDFKKDENDVCVTEGLGKPCEVGKDCPKDQVCKTLKCDYCEDGKEPNESQSKCNGATGHLLSSIIMSFSLIIFTCFTMRI